MTYFASNLSVRHTKALPNLALDLLTIQFHSSSPYTGHSKCNSLTSLHSFTSPSPCADHPATLRKISYSNRVKSTLGQSAYSGSCYHKCHDTQYTPHTFPYKSPNTPCLLTSSQFLQQTKCYLTSFSVSLLSSLVLILELILLNYLFLLSN